jgi:hypothetical protein
MSRCARCGAAVKSSIPIGRSSTCPTCNAYLHSCINCKFYSPGRHNDCAEPQADLVPDKRGANFCDYFVIRSDAGGKPGSGKKKSARDEFDKLFGG